MVIVSFTGFHESEERSRRENPYVQDVPRIHPNTIPNQLFLLRLFEALVKSLWRREERWLIAKLGVRNKCLIGIVWSTMEFRRSSFWDSRLAAFVGVLLDGLLPLVVHSPSPSHCHW